MRKIFIIIITIFASNIFAQQPGYISGEASVNLVVPLSVKSGAGDLDFGDILVTNSSFTETISPKKGKEFLVVGQPGRNVTIRFNSVELTNYQWASLNNGEMGQLKFIPNVVLQNSKKVIDGSAFPLNKKGLIGELILQVGGAITVNPKQPIGNYEGLFVLSVTY